uniref:Aminotransferase-like plant mobile domain-containing protein n=1 Tax=Oryza glumipatula TaxID=40148 RepID=A0A0E0A9G1_9ORYZ
MPDNVQEYQLTLYLEAYLLWLFGRVIFTGSHGNTVDARLIPLACQIAKAGDQPSLQPHNADYATAIFTGCPLLVMLFSFGRPYMSVAVAHQDDYTDVVDDRPTFGTRSYYGPPQWARIQVHNVYEYFTEAFESLRENEVRWTPYTNEEAILRAPNGICILCYRDEAYWITRKMLVYNIFVEGWDRTSKSQFLLDFCVHQMCTRDQGIQPQHYEQYMAWYSLQNRIRLLPPEDTDKRGPPTIGQIYDMQLAPPAHLTSDIAGELVKEAKTLWEKLRDGIACTNQEVMAVIDYLRRKAQPKRVPPHSSTPITSQWQSGFASFAEGARMVRPVPQMPLARPHMIPQMAPDVATSHWQGGFAPFAGTSQGIPTYPKCLRHLSVKEGLQPTQSVPLHAPTYGTNPWQGQFMDYSEYRVIWTCCNKGLGHTQHRTATYPASVEGRHQYPMGFGLRKLMKRPRRHSPHNQRLAIYKEMTMTHVDLTMSTLSPTVCHSQALDMPQEQGKRLKKASYNI